MPKTHTWPLMGAAQKVRVATNTIAKFISHQKSGDHVEKSSDHRYKSISIRDRQCI
jgi:hypothetical protein